MVPGVLSTNNVFSLGLNVQYTSLVYESVYNLFILLLFHSLSLLGVKIFQRRQHTQAEKGKVPQTFSISLVCWKSATSVVVFSSLWQYHPEAWAAYAAETCQVDLEDSATCNPQFWPLTASIIIFSLCAGYFIPSWLNHWSSSDVMRSTAW